MAIWCQWRYKDYKFSRWKPVFQIFCSQKYSILIITLFNTILIFIAARGGAGIFLYKSAFDWYDPALQSYYKIASMTTFSCVESVLNISFLWMIRYDSF